MKWNSSLIVFFILFYLSPSVVSGQTSRHPPQVYIKEISLDDDVHDLIYGSSIEKRFALKNIEARIKKAIKILRKGEIVEDVVREEAIILLEEIKEKTFYPLLEILKDKGLRKHAIFIFEVIGDERVLPYLYELKKESEGMGKKGKKLGKLVQRAIERIEERERMGKKAREEGETKDGD